MKKYFSDILAVAFVFAATLVPLCASAQKGTTKDGFKYAVKDNAVTITGWKGKGVDIVIPATIDGLPVQAIGRDAFRGKKIQSLALPDGITYIGDFAFFNHRLTSLVLPENIETGADAFATIGANPLTSIEAPHQLNTAKRTDLPYKFIVWYIVHGRQPGTYTYKDGVWHLDGAPPPPYVTLNVIGSTRLGSVNGDVNDSNYLISSGGLLSTKKHILPPGEYRIGLYVEGKGIFADGNVVEVNLEAGKTYEAGFTSDSPLVGARVSVVGAGPRTVKVEYYIKEVN
jgi:hypothetical protein